MRTVPCDFDGLTISQKFSELVRFSGVTPGYSDVKPVSEGDIRPDTLRNIHVMEYMGNGRIMVSADISNTQAKKKPEKTDILYDFPKRIFLKQSRYRPAMMTVNPLKSI